MLSVFTQYPFALKIILTKFHVERTGEKRNVRILLAQKPIESPRCRWENIKTDLKQTAWGEVLSEFNWRPGSTKCGEFLTDRATVSL